MTTVKYTKTGTKSSVNAKLPKDIFGLEVNNHELLNQAYNTYLANGRTNNAKVKTRGDVSGGGRKPWRQKGTGRARFGSTRNPIWRKGGVAFGPTGEENYSKKLSTTSKRTAIKQALSLKDSAGSLFIMEDIDLKSGKVSDAKKLLDKLNTKGRTLIILDNKDDSVSRATGNLQNVQISLANRLNVYDLLNADSLIITDKAIEAISSWLGAKK